MGFARKAKAKCNVTAYPRYSVRSVPCRHNRLTWYPRIRTSAYPMEYPIHADTMTAATVSRIVIIVFPPLDLDGQDNLDLFLRLHLGAPLGPAHRYILPRRR